MIKLGNCEVFGVHEIKGENGRIDRILLKDGSQFRGPVPNRRELLRILTATVKTLNLTRAERREVDENVMDATYFSQTGRRK